MKNSLVGHAHTTRTPARARNLVLSLTVSALLLLLAAVFTSPGALAHDKIIDHAPAAEQELEVSPDQILLTFNNPPQNLEPRIVIQDAAGQIQATGPVVVEDNTVFTELSEPLQAGEYKVSWRVVSSDGHPIEGIFGFTVLNSPEPTVEPTTEPAPEPSDEPTTAPTAQEEPSPDPEISTPPANSEASSNLGPVIWGLVILLVAGTVVVVGLRLRKSSEDSPSTDS